MGHSDRKHALLSSSGASRWLNCTPSARLEEKFLESSKIHTSSYAEEGTLAHEFADLELRKMCFPEQVTKAVYNKEIKKLRKNKYYTDEMEKEVNKYVFYIHEEITAVYDKDPVILIEERLDYSHLVPEGFGTGDAIIISEGFMEIIDLKYGKGVMVSAEENPQLSLYALAAYEKYSLLYDIEHVRLTIIQPRLSHHSSWETPIDDLLEWGEKIVKPAAQLAHKGEGELKVGDHCKWCKVKAVCSAMAKKNLEVAKHDFTEPYLLEDDEILEIFKVQPMLSDWVNSVAQYVLEKAIQGKEWPGYKIVEGRSSRSWTDEQKVKDKLDKYYKLDDFIIKKLAGIPFVEKTIGKEFFNVQFGELVNKPQGAPTLVPVSDKRPPFRSSAADDFSDSTD